MQQVFASLNISKLKSRERVDLLDCLNLDQEALFQQKTYSNYRLRLSGEEAPSYFTHRTTKASSSLTIPLLPSSFSQPFLQFRACFVFNCDDWLPIFEFKGRFWNSFNSFGQALEFRENVYLYSKGLFVSPSVVSISMIHPDDSSRF